MKCFLLPEKFILMIFLADLHEGKSQVQGLRKMPLFGRSREWVE